MCLTENMRPESQARARKLLVESCQRLFEQGFWSDLPVDRDELEKTTASRGDVQQFEKKVAKFRRQWIQNVKFIGELYKEKVLGTRVIHKCIAKLLDGSNGKFCDGSLEGFCRLLSNIGEVHEWDTNRRLNTGIPQPKEIVPYDHYFTLVDQIIASKKGSLRTRFMLQDLRELRKNAWDSRWRQFYKEDNLSTRVIHRCLINLLDEVEKGEHTTKNSPNRFREGKSAEAACPWTIDACPWYIDRIIVYCSSCQVSLKIQGEDSSPKPASWIRETTRSCPVNLFSPPWLIRHSEDERKKDCQ